MERHWLAVKMLALELRATGTVRRQRAQELLDRWIPVKGESLFQVLRNAQRPRRARPGQCATTSRLKTHPERPVRQGRQARGRRLA
jgi:hypothetical protein